jgi:hypothetical protein
MAVLTAFVIFVLPIVCVVQDRADPDVWLQLLERCAAEPNCQPTAMRSMAQQLVAQQQQITAQQQQLVEQQQVASKQDGRIGVLQGQLQAVQAQLQELLQRQHQ